MIEMDMTEQERRLTESVLDMPRETLDQEMWSTREDGETVLTEQASQKISSIVQALREGAGLREVSVNITGSITSNSYTDDSDIDLHFSSPEVKKSDAEGMTVKLRKLLEQFKAEHGEESCRIGPHPVEVYFQPNPFQDLMSVGCYSFTEKRWLVGPEMTDMSFNPYSEYFRKDMQHVDKIVRDIRDMILQVYERALVLDKLDGEERDKQLNAVKSMLKRAAMLFSNAKKMRTRLSSPTSAEEAKKMRDDKKWKIVDSAFKLMDKFGYLAILKAYTTMHEEDLVDADQIIEVVRDNLGPANKKLHERDQAECGFGGDCGVYALKLAKKCLKQGHLVQIVFCADVSIDDRDELLNEGTLYHVAVMLDGDQSKIYDASGRVDVQRLKKFCKDEYRDPDPDIWALEYRASDDEEDKWIEKAIRNATSWTCWTESERMCESKSAIVLIASLLAMHGILPREALADSLSRVPRSQMHMMSKPVQNAIDKATMDNTMVGKFSYRNSVNILQWVHYTEAANQELEGRKAIMSVIWNRAGGDPKKLLEVALKSGTDKKGKRIWQFSEWQPGNPWKLVAPASDKDWKYKVPSDITNPKVQKIWKEGEQFAKMMLDGKWKSNIGKYNLIISDRANDVAKSTWGKDCNCTIGDHRFGYDPSQDGFKRSSKTYSVVKGDTGLKIAKSLSMKFADLKSKNPDVDWNRLQVGQKLKI